MQSDFMVKIANIIAEIRVKTCIDDVDAEVLEDILKDELIKYHNEVFTYGHGIGYDDGYDDGYTAGKSSLEGDVDNAYDEGYALGYSEGYSDGRSEGNS